MFNFEDKIGPITNFVVPGGHNISAKFSMLELYVED